MMPHNDILYLILPIIIMFSISFMRVFHPLSAGLVLLIQTTLVAIASGTLNKTFWFSYILFLIFLGGMLVLFIYVASLASNEQFSIDLTFFLVSFTTICLISLLLITLDPIILSNKMTMACSSLMNDYKFNSNSLFNSPIYNTPSAFFTFFIISYLLLALLVVVKIMKSSSGPLRLMTYENTHT
uniref:NADH-ubiquinone oxidoreductase chain 6 n=1 Tax=Pagurus nigrofascia TaxID=1929472 RepID=A0A2Z5UXX9_9EUCA|nr:NADH dehydrogenase subunit 6 [Pagurus nigrofascia]QCI56246.1 NADH dehydrogenase subunit 6 [Pagurus nigrofascia]BBB16255.1 NADH dehydrogenase subunit 6 [Pagurus nigrofascia]